MSIALNDCHIDFCFLSICTWVNICSCCSDTVQVSSELIKLTVVVSSDCSKAVPLLQFSLSVFCHCNCIVMFSHRLFLIGLLFCNICNRRTALEGSAESTNARMCCVCLRGRGRGVGAYIILQDRNITHYSVVAQNNIHVIGRRRVLFLINETSK